ncbi:MAG TPA: thiol-disulfide isomerase [Terriglobia bacterium]|nr:thiol-disulfide isomerase [Terriglobia bacterium]
MKQIRSLAGPVLLAGIVMFLPAKGVPFPQARTPTFYKDVLPILQDHCQSCHRPGEIGPMTLLTYQQTRAKASKILQRVRAKTMPPWFADPKYGHFSNDPSLTAEQIQTISAWVGSQTPAGNRKDAPPEKVWVSGWNIPQPEEVVRMPKAVAIPAKGEVEYTYEILPTGFKEDRWVQMAELRPSSREHVHHAVVYIRPPESLWLRNAPVNVAFTGSTFTDAHDQHDAHWTDSDMLLVYAPGSSPDHWPDSMAKFVPAGSDLVVQMHYTTNGRPARDQAAVGLVFAKQLPLQRVLTLQLTNSRFSIPPGEDNYRVDVSGTLPNDATLLGFLPHMHLRGKSFEYNILYGRGQIETLLRVNFDFRWQLTYRMAQPRPLKAGTRLQAVAWFDNSSKNPHNPDPHRTVTWGDQTSDEMMVGFFDVAVPRNVDKQEYFIRQ